MSSTDAPTPPPSSEDPGRPLRDTGWPIYDSGFTSMSDLILGSGWKTDTRPGIVKRVAVRALVVCAAISLVVILAQRMNAADDRLYAAIAAKHQAFKDKCESHGGFVIRKYGGGLITQPYDDCVFPPAKE